MAQTEAPSHITPELFREWRSPRRGAANPERMTNAVWSWLVESRLSAYQANERFGGDSACTAGPGWCFERFGQSSTTLPDGRIVYIAGEHEDFYDPDFFIYNDVTIVSPSGEVEIFGYPTDAFPPTDFHSATLIGQQILIVGNLSYPSDRRAGATQVMLLDLGSWRMSHVQAEGTSPGWIHGHEARLADDARALLISGGTIDRVDGEDAVENIDEWRLTLDDWKWERLSHRRWRRFEARRHDRRHLHLQEIHNVVWSKSVGWHDDAADWELKLEAALGAAPRLDVFPTLYQPSLPHDALARDGDEYNVHRVRIDGVIVRFVEDLYAVQVTIEGDLPAEAVEQLRAELVEKLSALERVPVVSREIENR